MAAATSDVGFEKIGIRDTEVDDRGMAFYRAVHQDIFMSVDA
jgi:hypothetical protein